MAHASRRLRKLRRTKREKSQAFRMVTTLLKEREQARGLMLAQANRLERYLETYGEIKDTEMAQETCSECGETKTGCKALTQKPDGTILFICPQCRKALENDKYVGD